MIKSLIQNSGYDSGFRRIGTGPLPRNRSTQVIR